MRECRNDNSSNYIISDWKKMESFKATMWKSLISNHKFVCITYKIQINSGVCP